MHVFLTGDRRVGKSTAVLRTAKALQLPRRGFLTRFLTGERGSALYMVPAEQPDLMDDEHLVAVPENGKMRPVAGRFDTLGVQLLQDARQRPGTLILMDECGHLEKDALLFHHEILECLNGDSPVLGVLRRDQDWHGFIRRHPRVRVLTVTEDNRDGIAREAAALLREK